LFTEVFTDTTDARYQALKSAYDIMPTDGNGVSAGGDMGQIAPGHTYEEVDDILNTYIQANGQAEAQASAVDRLNAAYGAETIERVLKRHRNSEFKRKRLPIAIPRSLYE
jgi:NH3-dependent NAD+ synthetase